jgi:hypothetical protein
VKATGATAKLVKKAAARFPGVEEGVACAGTSLESMTFNAKGKAFVFAAVKDGVYSVRVKLDASVSEAKKLAKSEPGLCSIGSGNWAKLTWPEKAKPPARLLEKWIAESHDAVAG